jgi:hypothetical protein
MLIEFLLSREKQRTPELHTADYLPIFVNPTLALAKINSGLLKGQYRTLFFRRQYVQNALCAFNIR